MNTSAATTRIAATTTTQRAGCAGFGNIGRRRRDAARSSLAFAIRYGLRHLGGIYQGKAVAGERERVPAISGGRTAWGERGDLNPPAFWATTRRSNLLSYAHHAMSNSITARSVPNPLGAAWVRLYKCLNVEVVLCRVGNERTFARAPDAAERRWYRTPID